MVIELAIAGSRVAWLNVFGNSESGDYLFTNSALRPRSGLSRRRYGSATSAAQAVQRGSSLGLCGEVDWWGRSLREPDPGNRWRTTSTGSITLLGYTGSTGHGSSRCQRGPKSRGRRGRPEALGRGTRRNIGLYSTAEEVAVLGDAERTSGGCRPQRPQPRPARTPWQARPLQHSHRLASKDLHPARKPGPAVRQALAVQGNIAVYPTPARFSKNTDGESIVSESAIRALNLSNGKDRPVGRLPGHITLTRIDSTGLVYTNNNWTNKNGYENKLVFVPFKQVAAAVS